MFSTQIQMNLLKHRVLAEYSGKNMDPATQFFSVESFHFPAKYFLIALQQKFVPHEDALPASGHKDNLDCNQKHQKKSRQSYSPNSIIFQNESGCTVHKRS